jgi:hypothetical protein
MNLNEIESHVEIAVLVEELERVAVEVEERRTEELKERALRGEVFVRPTKVREVVYQYFELHNHFEARKFVRSFASTTKKLDFYVNAIATKVCEFFKQYNLYRKPVPRELIERVVDYYFEAIKASRRVQVMTKTFSKRKREVRAPQGSRFVQKKLGAQGPKAVSQGREALATKALDEGAR